MGSMLSYPVISAITGGLSGATIGSILGASIGMNIGSVFGTLSAIICTIMFMFIGMCIGGVIGIGLAVIVLRGINKIWNWITSEMKINVYVGEHKFSIWANSENTILDIKEAIARNTEIDLPKLKLIHNNRELIAGTIISNGISSSNSTLFVEGGLDLRLNLTDNQLQSSGDNSLQVLDDNKQPFIDGKISDQVLFLVCEDMKASELYKLVRCSRMINFDSKYIEIGGQRLKDDSQTLKDCGVLRGSFIHIKDRNPIINFYIRCCGEIKLPVSVRQTYKVLQLKDIVESERGVDPKKQCLKFNGESFVSELINY